MKAFSLIVLALVSFCIAAPPLDRNLTPHPPTPSLMKAVLLATLALPFLLGAAEPPPILPSVHGLAEPSKLGYVERVLDGGSFVGYVRSANGTKLVFWIKQGFSKPVGELSLAMSYENPRWVSPEDLSWTREEFLTFLQSVIQRQFRWQTTERKLVALKPDDFANEFERSITEKIGTELLRYIEGQLKTTPSFMK
jgi:hypothetical protein